MSTNMNWIFFALCLFAVPNVVWASTKISGTVNLNTATAQELDLLPSVGQKAVENILEYRKHKAFAKPEDLMRVKGFGKKRFHKIRPYISVDGATTAQRAPSLSISAPNPPH